MILKFKIAHWILSIIFISSLMGGNAFASPIPLNSTDEIMVIAAGECNDSQWEHQQCQMQHCSQCLFIMPFEPVFLLNPVSTLDIDYKYGALAHIMQPVKPPPIL